ncbi:MAG: hypothetical protein IJ679_01410 [Lachnospiraceae bacterium]|nr:hypothetical protein [Lachnospiraceae bacterium]
MAISLEIAERAIKEFQKIQEYMLLAKKENATALYEKLKADYLSTKALLQVAGVNLSELDVIKE